MKRQAYVFALLMSMVLGGCVTTKTGVFTAKADQDKALEYSTKAARSYIRDGNWEAARRHLKNALEIDDSDSEVHEAMALVFQNTGELELAESHFKRAISLGGDLSRIRYNYGVFLYSQQDYKEAGEQFEKVTDDTLYRNRAAAFMNLGHAYRQQEKLDQAKEAYLRSYLIDKKNSQSIIELAKIHFVQGEFSESYRFYTAYRKLVSKQSSQALWLGIQLADKFDDKNAMASYVLALKNLYPKSQEYLEYKNAYGR